MKNNELVCNLQNLTIKEKEFTIKTIKDSYVIKKWTNKNKTNLKYKQKQKFKFEDLFYFDIETVSYNQAIKFANKNITLNVTKFNPLKQFSILFSIKKKILLKKILCDLDEVIFKTDLDKNIIEQVKKGAWKLEKNNKVFDIFENSDYYIISYYDEDSFECLNVLAEIIKSIGKNMRTKPYFVGFNSNRFDTLILRHSYGFKLSELKNENAIDVSYFELGEKKYSYTFYDVLKMAKSFGKVNLKKLGEYLGIEKIDNDKEFESVEKFIEYNKRDVEILYFFVKHLNEMGIFENNHSSFARKYFINYAFKKYDDVDYIETSKYINKFDVFAARTEPYKNKVAYPKYVDVNSLYTSGRVVLDMVVPEIRENSKGEKKLLYDMKPIKDFKIIELKLYNLLDYFLENIDKSFTPSNLQKLYNKNFGDKFFLGYVKIKKFRREIPQNVVELIKFYFPFVFKNLGRSLFQFRENQIYQVGFFELLFLVFFEFEIIELYEMKKGNDIFKEHLVELYKLRKQNPDLKMYYKLLLNIGFGIWITKNERSEYIADDNLQELLHKNFNKSKFVEKINFEYRNETFKIKQIGDKFFKLNLGDKKWIESTIPVLGFNIISNARFFMYSVILNDIFKSDEEINIFYTDTDSFFCSEKFNKKLDEIGLIGNELGQFKDEAQDKNIKILEAQFLAPKSYFYKYKLLNDIKDKNGEVILEKGSILLDKHFKGTGKDFRKNIVLQSFKQNFNIIDKVAFQKTTMQKRTLRNNVFENEMSDESYFDIWEKVFTDAENYCKSFELGEVENKD